MSLWRVKCFNCRKKGHLVANCPGHPRKNEKPVDSARWIESGTKKVVANETSNPWVLTVTTEEEESKPAAGTLPQ